MNNKIILNQDNILHYEKISVDYISITASDSSGLVTIDTTKGFIGGKTFSNVKIFQMKRNGRILISPEYQLIYSAAQIYDFLKKNSKIWKTLEYGLHRMDISPKDYVIRGDQVVFTKQKLIAQKKYRANFDCSDYVVVY